MNIGNDQLIFGVGIVLQGLLLCGMGIINRDTDIPVDNSRVFTVFSTGLFSWINR